MRTAAQLEAHDHGARGVAAPPALRAPERLGSLVGNRALGRMLSARPRGAQGTLARCACGGHAPTGDTCTSCAAKEQEDDDEHAHARGVLRRAVVARRTLARACSPAADCAVPQSSLTEFVQQTEAKPENVSKAAKRSADCAAGKASCTSDGHAAVATALTQLLKDRSPSRLDSVGGLFVNKDMPADYGAVTVGCAGFTPPLAVGSGKTYCTTVPAAMEAEAKQYLNPQTKIIGGTSRYSWVTRTLMTLTHETEHGRFDSASDDPAKTPLKGPTTGSCKPSDVQSDLSEMSAQMSEFPILLRRLAPFPDDVRKKRLAAWFDYHLNNGSEDVTGTLKSLRCTCECSEVDAYVKQVVAFAQAGWSTYERWEYHTEMKQPAHKLAWPVDPPALDVNDLPPATPVVDAKDKTDLAAALHP